MRRLLIVLALLTAGPARGDEPILVIDSGGHTAVITDIVFTRDGRQLVSAGKDKVVRVWDIENGAVVRTIRGEIGPGREGKIYAAALSPDERVLAVGGWLAGSPNQSRAVRLHDFLTGQVLGLLEGHENVILDLAFSPDGRTLASGSADDTVRLWDVMAKKPRHVLHGHNDDVYAIALSPDGERLASGSYDHTVRLWDVASGELLRELTDHEDKVRAASFSPDGLYLASGSDDRTVRLWAGHTGEMIKVLAQQETSIGSLSFSPDGRRLLTGTGAVGRDICHVYTVPSGGEVSRFEHDNIVLATAFAPDGHLVATGGGNTFPIELWRPEDGQPVRRFAGQGHPVWSIAFGRDGKSVAFGNKYSYRNPIYWGPLERTILLEREGHIELALSDPVTDEAAFQRALAEVVGLRLETPSGSVDPRLRIVREGRAVLDIEHNMPSGFRYNCFTFSDDGRYVVSGAGWGVLTVYDSATGEKVRDLVGHTGDVWAVAVSPDDRFVVSGSADQTVRLWDLATGGLLVSFFLGQDEQWVAWTPKGYYTASLRGDRYVGWHLNRGVDQAAEYYPVHFFRRQYYRPDVVAKVLELRDHELALREADRLRMAPPSVFVIEPHTDGLTVTVPVLRVRVAAVSPSAAITDLTVTLNGRVVNRLEGVAKNNPRERLEELEVDLAAGENVLTFVAATDRAQSAPEVRRVTYRPPGDRPSGRPGPKLAVLAVGISDYVEESLRLRYADDDAVAVAELFAGQEGKAFSEVVTRVLGGSVRATRREILTGLGWLREQTSGRGDVRLLFLSGHGDVDSRGDYYFLAQDHVPGEDPEAYDVSWLTLLSRLTEGDATAILMVDTCHAAAAGRRRKEATNDFTWVINGITANVTGLVSFTASTGWEVSVERASWQHGAFTQALLVGLRDGLADGHGGPQDGVVEAKELGAWIVDWVSGETKGAQKPNYSPSPGLDDLQLFRLGGE